MSINSKNCSAVFCCLGGYDGHCRHQVPVVCSRPITELKLSLVAWPLWFAQILVAFFFTSGFIGHYQDIYDIAFNPEHSARQRWTARIAGLLSVWVMHHSQALNTPQYFVSLALLAVGLIVMRRYRVYIRKTLWASVGIFAYAGIIFWMLLPSFSTPENRLMIMIRSIIMFIAIASMAAILWIREHNADVKHARLRQLANYDQLTNAKTYSLYQHDLTHMFESTRAAGQPLSLVALDIDHFKQINDHYGHLAGNAVLIGVATTLSDVLGRFGDAHQIYRTGGEEFNIVFPNLEPKAVVPIITACWEAVRKSRYQYEGYDIAVTLSMGMTAVRQGDVSIDDTYKRADDNLCLSKRAGREYHHR